MPARAGRAATSPLLPTADELADRYSLVSGQPLGHWEFYMALAYFKLAIIAAGIDFRRRMSLQAAGKDDADDIEPEVPALATDNGLIVQRVVFEPGNLADALQVVLGLERIEGPHSVAVRITE